VADGLRFADPEGLHHELIVYTGDESALCASAPDIPEAHALQGFHAARAYADDPDRSSELLTEKLGFERQGSSDEWMVGGDKRSSFYTHEPAPAEPGIQGAGSVHHIAFATYPEEQEAWQQRMSEAGTHATPVIDRFYFRSIYFREPSGVLFELATMGPGFTADEPLEELGQHLSLPPDFEHLRERLGGVLTPLPDPRTERSVKS
jgi:glyoxalase family protein